MDMALQYLAKSLCAVQDYSRIKRLTLRQFPTLTALFRLRADSNCYKIRANTRLPQPLSPTPRSALGWAEFLISKITEGLIVENISKI